MIEQSEEMKKDIVAQRFKKAVGLLSALGDEPRASVPT